MGERKRNLNFMNLLLYKYTSESNNLNFTKEQIILVQELIALDYLNPSAFDLLKGGSEIYACAMTGDYPLTARGKEYMDMGWYKTLQQSGKYQLIRDIAAFIGATAGIAVGILRIFFS
jgi:hypothetical protein